MNIGDRVKIKGTKETYELGIQHKLGVVVALKGDGDLIHVRLDLGRLVKLSSDEVLYAKKSDEMEARIFSPKDAHTKTR